MSPHEAAPPPRDSAPARIWVPGRLFVSERGELCSGAQVGYGGAQLAFQHTPAGRWSGLTEWTHRAWLVTRSSLRPPLPDDHAIILPESLVDRDAQPFAHRWLAAQPLLCVSGLKERALIDAGVRVYRVEHGVAPDGRFALHAEGGRGPTLDVAVPPEALRTAELRSEDRRPSLDRDSDPSIFHRLLCELSDNALTEPGVVCALAARCLVEDGYGYRGQQAGEFRSLEAIAYDARALDALFEQIYERADRQRADAKRIQSALPTALVEADEVEVPIYGKACRVAVPALSLPAGDRDDETRVFLEQAGERLASLELPAMDRWFVDAFEDCRPTLPPELARELSQQDDGRSSPAVKLAAFVVLLAAAVAAAVTVYGLTR